jgi:hypothetical protein
VAPNMTVLTVARFITGTASGASSVLVPIYMGELSPPAFRSTTGEGCSARCNNRQGPGASSARVRSFHSSLEFWPRLRSPFPSPQSTDGATSSPCLLCCRSSRCCYHQCSTSRLAGFWRGTPTRPKSYPFPHPIPSLHTTPALGVPSHRKALRTENRGRRRLGSVSHRQRSHTVSQIVSLLQLSRRPAGAWRHRAQLAIALVEWGPVPLPHWDVAVAAV